ncbi:MAG: 16S rRNA (uracil(1498)-N(3))-methyltransferase [Rikenellaceae bacterium]
MQLFYCEHIEGDRVTLDREESTHAVRVLRRGVGDSINIIDGRGTLFSATIVKADIKGCVVEIFSKITDYGERNYKLHIAIAPTKNIDRFEWFLEKSTELGCDHFTPLLCDRSERKVVKDERSGKIIMSAVKQSLKAFLPHHDTLTRFDEFISQEFEGYKRFIAHCSDEQSERLLLRDQIKAGDKVVILIGPEGDFSPSEVQRALECGFLPISLGTARLRTETAGVMCASLLNIINQ